ncbi:MAG: 30S ribosomal protein S6 [Candidatus Saelkia tenebricola]|nr:30S ribosomal protein S6 [Candidatus Saelkia tenebricola]
MKKYEVMFILNPDLNDAEVNSEMEKIKSSVTKRDGRVHELNIWGRRQLAYSIKKFQEGVYLLGYFDLSAKSPRELSGEWELNANILRSFILKKEK